MKTRSSYFRKCTLLLILLPFFLSLLSCGGLSSVLNSLLTDQNMESILSLSEQSGCKTIDIGELRGLISEVGDSNILDVFGISEDSLNALIDDYEAENRASLCLFTATLSGSTTHQSYFFTTDDNHTSNTWDITDVQITETLSDGSTQSYSPSGITAFSDFASDAANTAFSFSAVMDYSGSMSDNDLSALESGLTALYQNIPDNFRSEVMKFSEDVSMAQTYTDDNSALVLAVTSGDPDRSSTALYDGIYEGLTNTSSETAKVRFVIAFTDGLENASSHTRSEVVSLAQAQGIPLILIGMGTIVDVADLLQLANDTGGFFFYASSYAFLSTAFSELEEYLANTHVVTWTSANTSGVSSVTLGVGGGAFTGTYTP